MRPHNRDQAHTPEPMRDLSDEHLETALRDALRERAESTQISGAGLSIIRERVSGPTRMRVWRPASSTSTLSSTPSTPSSTPSNSPSATTIIGTPAPIGSGTPTMYPMANTQQTADALDGGALYQPGGAPIESAEQLASSFVTTATNGAAGPVITSNASSSKGYVPGSDGAVVKVFGQAGNLVTVVYLKAVTKGSQAAYVVIGASLPGGDAKAQLTIDSTALNPQVPAAPP